MTKKGLGQVSWNNQTAPFVQAQQAPMEKHIFKEDPVAKALQMGPGSPEYIATFGQQPHGPNSL